MEFFSASLFFRSQRSFETLLSQGSQFFARRLCALEISLHDSANLFFLIVAQVQFAQRAQRPSAKVPHASAVLAAAESACFISRCLILCRRLWLLLLVRRPERGQQHQTGQCQFIP